MSKNQTTNLGSNLALKLRTLTMVIVLLMPFLLVTFVAQKTDAAESDLSRSYNAAENISVGSLVSFSETSESNVVPANNESAERLIGVAVTSDQSFLAVNTEKTKTQVAISGQAYVLVSDLNGEINAGDLISTTPFTGIGAKAEPGDRVVGVAQQSFNTDSAGAKKTTITDLKGKEKQLTVGAIPVVISIGTMQSGSDAVGVGKGLQRWATNIAGKPVSLVRVVLCLIIGIVAIVSLVVVVYSSIHNSITAVSRNPLAKPAIFDALAQVMAMVAFIAVISVTIMYAILRI